METPCQIDAAVIYCVNFCPNCAISLPSLVVAGFPWSLTVISVISYQDCQLIEYFKGNKSLL